MRALYITSAEAVAVAQLLSIHRNNPQNLRGHSELSSFLCEKRQLGEYWDNGIGYLESADAAIIAESNSTNFPCFAILTSVSLNKLRLFLPPFSQNVVAGPFHFRELLRTRRTG